MAIKEAAARLAAHLSNATWLTAVGVGEQDGKDCIYLYVKAPKKHEISFLNDGWEGFPVIVRKVGAFSAGTTAEVPSDHLACPQ
jgi:hypothetical protein